MSNPNIRYLQHFGGAMLGYTVVLLASGWFIESREITGWLAGVLSLAPMLPAFYALHAAVMRFRTMDEVQRRIVSESILWSAGVVGFVSFGYGFLEGSVNAPAIAMIWVMPALIGTYGIALIFVSRQFK